MIEVCRVCIKCERFEIRLFSGEKEWKLPQELSGELTQEQINQILFSWGKSFCPGCQPKKNS